MLVKFCKYGKSGMEISDFFFWYVKMVDDICVLRLLVIEQINYDLVYMFMNIGIGISGCFSMGLWINYGLGSMSENLFGFVVLISVGGCNF